MLTAAIIAFAVLLLAWIAAPTKREGRTAIEVHTDHQPIAWESDVEPVEVLPKAA
jgi:hypothetical protein